MLSSDVSRCFTEKDLWEQLLKVVSDRKNKYVLYISIKCQLNNIIMVKSHTEHSVQSSLMVEKWTKNIASSKPNEKVKIKYQHLFSIAAQACVFNEESPFALLWKTAHEGREAKLHFRKILLISEKGDYAHKPWRDKEKRKERKKTRTTKKPSRPCCLQELTSAFAFENDQVVPVGILGWQNMHK